MSKLEQSNSKQKNMTDYAIELVVFLDEEHQIKEVFELNLGMNVIGSSPKESGIVINKPEIEKRHLQIEIELDQRTDTLSPQIQSLRSDSGTQKKMKDGNFTNLLPGKWNFMGDLSREFVFFIARKYRCLVRKVPKNSKLNKSFDGSMPNAATTVGVSTTKINFLKSLVEFNSSAKKKEDDQANNQVQKVEEIVLHVPQERGLLGAEQLSKPKVLGKGFKPKSSPDSIKNLHTKFKSPASCLENEIIAKEDKQEKGSDQNNIRIPTPTKDMQKIVDQNKEGIDPIKVQNDGDKMNKKRNDLNKKKQDLSFNSDMTDEAMTKENEKQSKIIADRFDQIAIAKPVNEEQKNSLAKNEVQDKHQIGKKLNEDKKNTKNLKNQQTKKGDDANTVKLEEKGQIGVNQNGTASSLIICDKIEAKSVKGDKSKKQLKESGIPKKDNGPMNGKRAAEEALGESKMEIEKEIEEVEQKQKEIMKTEKNQKENGKKKRKLEGETSKLSDKMDEEVKKGVKIPKEQFDAKINISSVKSKQKMEQEEGRVNRVDNKKELKDNSKMNEEKERSKDTKRKLEKPVPVGVIQEKISEKLAPPAQKSVKQGKMQEKKSEKMKEIQHLSEKKSIQIKKELKDDESYEEDDEYDKDAQIIGDNPNKKANRMNVLFSNCNLDGLDVEVGMKKLGVRIMQTISQPFNILVMDEFTRRAKTLVALNKNAKIISSQWVLDCICTEKLLENVDDYLINVNPLFSNKYNFDYQVTRKRHLALKKALFEGIQFLLPDEEEYANITRSDLEYIITTAGGSLITQQDCDNAEDASSIKVIFDNEKEDSQKQSDRSPDKSVRKSRSKKSKGNDDERDKLVQILKGEGFQCVRIEGIFMSCLQQKVCDWKIYNM